MVLSDWLPPTLMALLSSYCALTASVDPSAGSATQSKTIVGVPSGESELELPRAQRLWRRAAFGTASVAAGAVALVVCSLRTRDAHPASTEATPTAPTLAATTAAVASAAPGPVAPPAELAFALPGPVAPPAAAPTARVARPCEFAIASTPTNTDVFVDGRTAGRTPALIEAACDHAVTVVLTRAGFKRWERHVTASSGEPTRVAATLRAVTGRVTIESTPPGAIAWIADLKLGPTPVSADVDANVASTVTLRLAGHRPYQLQVVPSAYRESQIFARLVAEPLIAVPDWDHAP